MDKIQRWSDVWLLKLNVDKCMVVSYGRQVEKNKYVMVQNNCIVELQRDAYVKDLGVVFDEKLNLNFSQHITERINKAYSMLWLIRRNFRDKSMSDQRRPMVHYLYLHVVTELLVFTLVVELAYLYCKYKYFVLACCD